MDKAINKIINRFIQQVQKERIQIERAYLFGSYAKRRQNNNSDIDIALVYKNNKHTDNFDLQVQLLTIASDIDTRIEPHPIAAKDFNINNPLVSEILHTGFEIPY